jgi:hypothetical protein
MKKNKYFTNEFFYVFQTIQNRPGAFEMLRQPMVDMYLHALMQEGVLSIICETRLDKQ